MSKHTPDYSVLKDGTVRSLSNWRGYGAREMQWTPNEDGYPSVRILIDGKRRRIAVHVLVARAWLLPRPSPAHQLRHLDGDKWNPHADNLAWGTAKDNADDRERHGRTSRGERHSATIKASDHAQKVKRGADHYETKARLANV